MLRKLTFIAVFVAILATRALVTILAAEDDDGGGGTVPLYTVWLPVVYSQQPWPCLAELWAEPVFPEEGYVVPRGGSTSTIFLDEFYADAGWSLDYYSYLYPYSPSNPCPTNELRPSFHSIGRDYFVPTSQEVQLPVYIHETVLPGEYYWTVEIYCCNSHFGGWSRPRKVIVEP